MAKNRLQSLFGILSCERQNSAAHKRKLEASTFKKGMLFTFTILNLFIYYYNKLNKNIEQNCKIYKNLQ